MPAQDSVTVSATKKTCRVLASLAQLSALEEIEAGAVLPMVRQRLAARYPWFPEHELAQALTGEARAIERAWMPHA